MPFDRPSPRFRSRRTLLRALLLAGAGLALPLEAAMAQKPEDLAMINAAGRGDLPAVEAMLAAGASVTAVDRAGRTALIAAAYRNHLEVARRLIAAGADVNAQDATRQSAFLIATSDGYVELLELTLANGADVHAKDSYNGTGLIRAADRGHVEIIRRLINTPMEMNHVNRLGWTALLEAIILGDGSARYVESVRLLVEGGADVNLADSGGETPLAHARSKGFAEIAAILETVGAR